MPDVLATLLDDHGADAALISHLPKIRHLCGFRGSRALMVAQADAACLVTDPRYAQQAHNEVQRATVVIAEGEFITVLSELGLLEGADMVLFESDHRTVAEHAAWQRAFPSVRWLAGQQVLQGSMARKSAAAIEHMKQAQALTEEAFLHVLENVRADMTEKQVAAALVHAHLVRGAARMAFDPIVASGPNSALPHARPTERRLRPGDLVLVDVGCIYKGYASDMTRMFSLGEPESVVRDVFGVVLEAQRRAIQAARAEMEGRALDAAARTVIAEAGYGPNFVHSVGHGIGREVHEWPRVSRWSMDILPAGATITIEPGIYLPGAFGIRIEDTVQLRREGCVRLGNLSRRVIVI